MFLHQNNNRANFRYPISTQPTIYRSPVILQEHSGKYPQHPRRQCHHRRCSPPAVRRLPLANPACGLRVSGASNGGFVTVHLPLKRKCWLLEKNTTACSGPRTWQCYRIPSPRTQWSTRSLESSVGDELQLNEANLWYDTKEIILLGHHNVLCSTVGYAGKQQNWNSQKEPNYAFLA